MCHEYLRFRRGSQLVVTTRATMDSTNPATGQLLARFPAMAWSQVDRALAEARQAFLIWREQSLAERGARLRQAAAYLRAHQSRLAGLITAEMGKPIAEAEAE